MKTWTDWLQTCRLTEDTNVPLSVHLTLFHTGPLKLLYIQNMCFLKWLHIQVLRKLTHTHSALDTAQTDAAENTLTADVSFYFCDKKPSFVQNTSTEHLLLADSLQLSMKEIIQYIKGEMLSAFTFLHNAEKVCVCVCVCVCVHVFPPDCSQWVWSICLCINETKTVCRAGK